MQKQQVIHNNTKCCKLHEFTPPAQRSPALKPEGHGNMRGYAYGRIWQYAVEFTRMVVTVKYATIHVG